MFIELLLFAVLVTILYYSLKKKHEYFKDTGLPVASPLILVGSLWRNVFKRTTMVDDLDKIYYEVGGERCRYAGFYNYLSPLVLLKDPELIKQICVKDFDSFGEHLLTVDEVMEPLFGKNLLSLNGQRWHDMRVTLSPAFTSSKIKNMCPFITECGQQMNEYLIRCCKENSVNDIPQYEIDLRDISTRYMNDVVANIAFGYKIDSFKDQNNTFFLSGKDLTTFTAMMYVKIMVHIAFPKLSKLLRLRLFPEYLNDFFRDIVLNAMKYRRENNVVRPDMIHLLMEAKKGSLRQEDTAPEKDAGFATVEESVVGSRDPKTEWSDEDLIAQAMLFFFGGFDTSSMLMSFLLHELALNQDIQKKLQDEVDANVKLHGEEPTYDTIKNLTYMDRVISEVLRKWPPGLINDRLCTKTVNLGPIFEGEDLTYTVKKNCMIWIPVFSIHRDPRYWPNPDKFDPERFSDENRDNIKSGAYLPFGLGPRNCIGSRFALMEAKIMIYHLMMKFTFEVSPKTDTTSELDRLPFVLKLKNGFWAKIVLRNPTT